jgi:hypothetical protein
VYPTNLWQLDAVVGLLQLDALLVRLSKRISHSFLVELRELGSLLQRNSCRPYRGRVSLAVVREPGLL